MPALSKSQQRLMGQAYGLKKGLIKTTDLNPDYREQIEDLAKGMTLKQLKDFAETSHQNLPEVKENMTSATVNSVSGMGAPSMPGNPGSQSDFSTQKAGSGDIPFALSGGKPKKKRSFLDFKDFIQQSRELRSSF